MVAGNAELLTEEQVAKLPGERWVPSQSGTPLRVPKEYTLADRMYLPLPTINSALGRVESIRRVVIAASTQFADRIEWIRRRLPGQDLIEENEKQTVGLLNILPTSDWVLRQQRGRRCRR